MRFFSHSSRAWPTTNLATVFSCKLSYLTIGWNILARIVILFQILIRISKCFVYSLIHILLFYALLNVLGAACPTDSMRLPCLWGVNCVLCGSKDQLGKLDKARTVRFLEFKHQSYDLDNMVRVSLFELLKARIYKFFAIINLVFLIEASHIFHRT